jgi:hypothetical protein
LIPKILPSISKSLEMRIREVMFMFGIGFEDLDPIESTKGKE